MVINKSGITIRIGVDTLRVMGRATQGVKLIRLRDEDSIASVAKVSKFESEEDDIEVNLESNDLEEKNIVDNDEQNQSNDSKDLTEE